MPEHLRGAVVALGNFDGFHKGHQAVVAEAIARARSQSRPAMVATFDPHPARLFRPDAPPFRLTTLDQRENLFGRAGADAMLVFPFTHAMASMSAQAFTEMLAGPLGIEDVVTGQDFSFGRGRSGNIDTLRDLGHALGLRTISVPPVADAQGEVISSSRIRAALQAGDCASASALLTRPFAIRGPVIHGDKRGRDLGYPTANMELGPYLRPAYGIYAVRAELADGRVVDGVANLGVRPTFDPPKELLETYLFDFDEPLYDQILEVSLIERIRPEAKFDGMAALIGQMDKDSARARAILAETPRLA